MMIRKNIKNIKNQKGVVFIITAFVILSVIILLVLAIDMARLYEVKQTIHTQAQLMAEAGIKLKAQDSINNMDIQRLYKDSDISEIIKNKDNNMRILSENTMSFVRDVATNNGGTAECEFIQDNGHDCFTCTAQTGVNTNRLIFRSIFDLINNGETIINIRAIGTSCYNPDAKELGLYPFFFID